MRKLSILFFSLICVSFLNAQTSSEFTTVTGTLRKLQDSTIITANVRYEKLPYYDDMGISTSSADGKFSFPLLKGTQYIITVNKENFIRLEETIKVEEDMVLNLYVKEDIVDLIKLENLIFNRGRDQITAGSFGELDQLANYLNENPSIIIQLEGHTEKDRAQNAEANLRLSQARVEAVKEYLVKKKVKKNRIFTKAFGGTQPLSEEDTDEAKALNRRVEVRTIRR